MKFGANSVGQSLAQKLCFKPECFIDLSENPPSNNFLIRAAALNRGNSVL